MAIDDDPHDDCSSWLYFRWEHVNDTRARPTHYRSPAAFAAEYDTIFTAPDTPPKSLGHYGCDGKWRPARR